MAEYASASWRRAIEHLTDAGFLTPPRIEIADRYARACAEYEVLYPEAIVHGPVKVGPNGGDVFNFQWSAVEKLNDRIAKFEAKLGMDVSGEAPLAKASKTKTAADEFLD
jgi:hypothetical protein